MNNSLEVMAKAASPYDMVLAQKEKSLYRGGLMLLACFTGDDFLDIPRMKEKERFAVEKGLYYTVPFMDEGTLYTQGTTRNLITIWSVEKKGEPVCEARIDIEHVTGEGDDYKLWVVVHGERTERIEFISKEGAEYFTMFKDTKSLVVSELISSP